MKAAQKKVRTLQSKRGKPKKADERKRLAFIIHQKKRRIATLAARIKQHEARLVGTPLICFGSRDLLMRAAASGVPIVREKLDFGEKKKTLGEAGARYAAMLSGFAYATFYRLLDRCAARHGVEVIAVNPAFTSILGYAKFGVGRKSVDEAAAIAIARRGLGCTERLRSRAMSPALRTMLMQAARARHMRHVWSGWCRFAPWLGKSRKTWASRCTEKVRAADVSPAIAVVLAKSRKGAIRKTSRATG